MKAFFCYSASNFIQSDSGVTCLHIFTHDRYFLEAFAIYECRVKFLFLMERSDLFCTGSRIYTGLLVHSKGLGDAWGFSFEISHSYYGHTHHATLVNHRAIKKQKVKLQTKLL